MVCCGALSQLLIGHQVTHPPTPHFPYCTADMAELIPVVGVAFKVRLRVKTYPHYLQLGWVLVRNILIFLSFFYILTSPGTYERVVYEVFVCVSE